MILPSRERTPSKAQHVTLTVLLAATFVEPTRTLFVPGDDPGLRWVALFVPYLLAFAWVALQPRRWPHLARRPGGWLLVTAIWLLVTSPWGLTPAVDLALAFGFLALAGLGVSLGGAGQWPMVRSALFWSLSLCLASSIAAVAAGAVNNEGRWAGVFGEANGLGFAAALAIIVGLDRWARRQRGGLALAVLAVPVLIQTDSRTSMLSALLGVAIWARPLIGRWAVPAAVALVAVGVAGSIATESLGGAAELVSRSGEAEEVATFTGRTWV